MPATFQLVLGDISNICDVSRDVLQGMYKMPLSRTSNINWHAMFLFAAAGILIVRSNQTRRGNKIPYKVNVDAFRANSSREKTGDKFDCRATLSLAQASAFTRICAATNSLELKYFNFDANFA